MNILITGGAGYIGSHTVVELIKSNHRVSIVDNFSNSSSESIKRVEKITGATIPFYDIDICCKDKLRDVFNKNNFNAVIHFAGLKSVNESLEQPLAYYKNNLNSTISLLEIMKENKVKKIIFSSSATVYGTPEELPLKETSRTGFGITNPYGQTKNMIEQILSDLSSSDKEFEIITLRYFNPIGAHKSGLIGEDPNNIPNNLLPYISQVAIGKLKELCIYGDDYDTTDGTGVRDYIHVVDLAKGHVAALKNLKPGLNTYNLGTGNGTSVLELVNIFSNITGKAVPYKITKRRPGDIATCFASVEKANNELSWFAEESIHQACADTWLWQKNNPNGYKTEPREN